MNSARMEGMLPSIARAGELVPSAPFVSVSRGRVAEPRAGGPGVSTPFATDTIADKAIQPRKLFAANNPATPLVSSQT